VFADGETAGDGALAVTGDAAQARAVGGVAIGEETPGSIEVGVGEGREVILDEDAQAVVEIPRRVGHGGDGHEVFGRVHGAGFGGRGGHDAQPAGVADEIGAPGRRRGAVGMQQRTARDAAGVIQLNGPHCAHAAVRPRAGHVGWGEG